MALPLRAAILAAPAPTPHATLVGPDADSKLQLRSLFEAVAMGPVAAPAGRNVPVRVATAKPQPGAPALPVDGPSRVTTRFAREVPDGALLGDRFTGPAAVKLRTSQ